jgi:hypothetical protein
MINVVPIGPITVHYVMLKSVVKPSLPLYAPFPAFPGNADVDFSRQGLYNKVFLRF